jgi:hypothetical protein
MVAITGRPAQSSPRWAFLSILGGLPVQGYARRERIARDGRQRRPRCQTGSWTARDGKPIADLSPGQRCSALLPIILLGSKAPLVLDQPEDNLDNQLITDLLVKALHGLKEHRQVIVVTRNPNIVVTGDAEQVVVMEATDGKCRVRRQASVDRIEIMRDIVDLMEGGKEALRRRFKRYWPEEQVPKFSFLEDAE